MQSRGRLVRVLAVMASLAAVTSAGAWLTCYLRGRRFALRDHLQPADAIVALAGTRGNVKNLDGKIATAVRLYQEGWAPTILFAGRFSATVNGTSHPDPAAGIAGSRACGAH